MENNTLIVSLIASKRYCKRGDSVTIEIEEIAGN